MPALSFRIVTLVAIAMAVLSGTVPQASRSVHASRDRVLRSGRQGSLRIERAEMGNESPDPGAHTVHRVELRPVPIGHAPEGASPATVNTAVVPVVPNGASREPASGDCVLPRSSHAATPRGRAPPPRRL